MSCKKSNTCCCDESSPGVNDLYNRPGKNSLSYRIGQFHSFFDQMKTRVSTWETPSGKRSIDSLTTREVTDPSIAVMDAWAVVGDVITFYQERIANEGYIRTAEERMSLLELARQIGYELKPGVSASTVICWKLDETGSGPDETVIPSGTQIQSIPSGGSLPQTFETGKEFTAYQCWNAMAPRIETPIDNSGSDAVLLYGVGLSVRPGDGVLLQFSSFSEERIVSRVKEDEANKATRIYFQGKEDTVSTVSEWPGKLDAPPLSPDDAPLSLTLDQVELSIYSRTITEKAFAQFCDHHAWDIDEVVEICRNLRNQDETMPEMYHYGEKVSFYGAQRPKYYSLPKETRAPSSSGADITKAYPYEWNDDTDIWYDPSKAKGDGANWSSHDCFLDREVDGIAPGQNILLRNGTNDPIAYEIEKTGVESLNSYAVSVKATGLTLISISKDSDYTLNSTRAYAGEKKMTPTSVPLASPFESGVDTMVLNDMVPGLQTGQTVVLTGTRADTENLEQSESLVLKEVHHSGGYTRLTFEEAIEYSYDRESMTLCANVTPVTHGEAVSGEVVGGSIGEAHQRFSLNKAPLTWINSETAPGGAEPTLTIRINGISWKQVDYFYGTDPQDEIYTLRLTDEGDTIVQFGDGIHGAIPPSGVNNITADYRTGIGREGLVDARTVSLVKMRPYGVIEALNPEASDDAEDPEKREDARVNAPRTVRTLDRIVSLCDYEDFCRTYAGIGKARAVEMPLSGDSIIHITVLSSTGDDVSDKKLNALNGEIEASRDSTVPFIVDNGIIRQVTLSAWLIIDDRYEFDTVAKECCDSLVSGFSFENRSFGQGIDADDIIRVLHDHEAVTAVDIDALALAGSTQANGIESYVEAPGARAISGMTYTGAVLLVMPKIGIELKRRMPAIKT